MEAGLPDKLKPAVGRF